MKVRSFSLLPFPVTVLCPAFMVAGRVARRSSTLDIRYEISGPLSELVIPLSAGIPVRKHGLWKETCFELFLGVGSSSRYWEFNLSPAGHWNVYRFADYRLGMQEEAAFASLPFNVRHQLDSLRLNLELDLDRIIRRGQSLDIAISTVTIHREGEVTYWALTHFGPEADFHRRESFTINL